MKKTPPRHIIIPDCQVREGVPLDHLTWAGKYIADHQFEVMVNIGDFADMPSLSEYDRGKRAYEGQRYRRDVDAVKRGMGLLMGPIAKVRSYKPKSVFTLGNHCHRIERAIEGDAKLEGTIAIEDLGYEEAGWEVHPFLEEVVVDGVTYSHYFPSGQMDKPCSSARKLLSTYHTSCVAGHLPGRDIAYARKGGKGAMTAIIAGSFYQHSEKYKSPLSNNHYRGLVVLNEVIDGDFMEMWVSLGYLKRKFMKGGAKYGRR